MFGSRKQTTVIAEGLKVVGNLTSEGLVEIYGAVEGEMNCTSVVIMRKAYVVGSIKAEHIVVDGTIEGPIECGEIIFNSHASVIGDVYCRTLIIEKGAFMEGHLRRIPDTTGRQSEGAKLLNKALTTPADRRKEAEQIALGENSTHLAELIVEARHLSGNPNLHPDEALAFLAQRAKPSLKPYFELGANSEKMPHANGRL